MKPSLDAHIKLKTWALPICVIALCILELVAPYQGWVALLVGLGGALLVGYVWVRLLARGLNLSREIRFGWAQVGDRLEERLTLVNDAWVPALWLEITDCSTLPGHNISCATGIDARASSLRLEYGTCLQRGAFTLGPTILCTGDPFGIFTLTLESSSFEKMIVVPPIVPLPSIEIASGGRAHEGRRRAAIAEPTVNAAYVRDYAPGDSLNSIHWRTVARRDELFVRVLDSTPSGDWWIFLDLNALTQFGQGYESTIEHGIIYAASLAARGLSNGRAVGLVASGDELVWLPPREGELQRWEILRALALVQPGTRPLYELLEHGDAASKRTASVIVITADMNGKWIDALLPFILRGCVTTVLLFDPTTFGSSQSMHAVLPLLADFEIAHYVMRREMLDRTGTTPGMQGRLDWHVTPQGRAILTRPLRQARWRTLA